MARRTPLQPFADRTAAAFVKFGGAYERSRRLFIITPSEQARRDRPDH
jgi:hypothetical protein